MDKQDKETKKVEKELAQLTKTVLETTPKEEGISQSQREMEAHLTAMELLRS